MLFSNEADRARFENLLEEMKTILEYNDIMYVMSLGKEVDEEIIRAEEITDADIEATIDETTFMTFKNYSNIEDVVDVHQFLNYNFQAYSIVNQDKINLQYFHDFIKSQIPNGVFVICKDDDDMPEGFNGQWIQKNKVYKVDDVMFDILSNNLAFKLHGLICNPPYETFNSRRFEMFNTTKDEMN